MILSPKFWSHSMDYLTTTYRTTICNGVVFSQYSWVKVLGNEILVFSTLCVSDDIAQLKCAGFWIWGSMVQQLVSWSFKLSYVITSHKYFIIIIIIYFILLHDMIWFRLDVQSVILRKTVWPITIIVLARCHQIVIVMAAPNYS